MLRRRVWAKGLGIVAVAAVLAIGGLVGGHATKTSAQAIMWFNPVTGSILSYQDTVSSYPVTVSYNMANEPVVSTVGTTMAPSLSTTYVTPSASFYAPAATSVYASPTAEWSNPGGSYCTLGNDQIWIPAGASPASYGC